MKNKLKVGQKVYLQPGVNVSRRDSSIKEGQITKVGTKYFCVTIGNSSYAYKFHIEDLKQTTVYTPDYYVWLNERELLDAIELKALQMHFYKLFYAHPASEAIKSLDKLRRMKAILEEEEENAGI